MIFARIGHGSCYYHWNEIFAGVSTTLRNEIYFKWEDGKPVDKTVDKITTRDGSDIHIVGGNFLNGLSLSETKAYWKNQAKNQGKDMPP